MLECSDCTKAHLALLLVLIFFLDCCNLIPFNGFYHFLSCPNGESHGCLNYPYRIIILGSVYFKIKYVRTRVTLSSV